MSFRDPGGRVLLVDRRVYRAVDASGMPNLDAFLTSETVRAWIDSGRMVGARQVEEPDAALASAWPPGGTLVEHDAIFFPSYPAEWSPSMLYAAAESTLKLAAALLDEQRGLKDASPFNILFRGPRPVFVDALSIEGRDPGDPLWIPRAQFERTFLLPLLAHRHLGVTPRHVFSVSREGLEPEELYAMCSPLRRLVPPFLHLVSLPVWLRDSSDLAQPYRARRVNPEQARFVLSHQFGRLQRALHACGPARTGRASVWSMYDTRNTYSSEARAAKEAFVTRLMRERVPRTVLDVGANIGVFSCIAAVHGAQVVAIDSDAAVIDALWQAAFRGNLDILPLVVNLAQPTSASGWRNGETLSFLDRAKGAFDAVFLLAIVHHLLVTERVPLSEIVDLTSSITTRWAVVEYVGREDPMFQRLCRGRDHLFDWYNEDAFRHGLEQRFRVVERGGLEGARALYLLEKRDLR